MIGPNEATLDVIRSMTHKMKALKLFFLCVLTLSLLMQQAYAQRSAPTLIRDNEIEEILKNWLTPLLDAAKMDSDSVRLIIVQSPQVNAFVAGGANIFIYTGLIDTSENAGEVIAVLAHELGHVAGGHLIASRAALERASYESILGTFLGIGAAIASGNAGAAQAVISGSQNIAQRRFLAHSRVNESSADQAALRFMNGAQINPSGLASFLKKLEDEELLPPDQQSEYSRTHPITRNRVEVVENGIGQSPYAHTPYPKLWDEQHALVKAKLMGYLNPGRVIWVYNDRDLSIPARYARSIAAYRENRIDEGLKGVNDLIALQPDNPYFYEIKGQMLLEFGRVEEAIPPYEKAVALKPDAALIRIALANALLQTPENKNRLKEAVKHLERALKDEPRSGYARRLLATAYGRLGDENKAKLNLAEEAVLGRRYDYAKTQAEAVLKSAPADSRLHLEASDILAYIETAEKYKN